MRELFEKFFLYIYGDIQVKLLAHFFILLRHFFIFVFNRDSHALIIYIQVI